MSFYICFDVNYSEWNIQDFFTIFQMRKRTPKLEFKISQSNKINQIFIKKTQLTY